MSTKTALHIVEAVANHEVHAPELGQIRLSDVLVRTQPAEVRESVNTAWRFLRSVDIFEQPSSNLPEVLTIYDKFSVVDEKVKTHLEFSDYLSPQEREQAEGAWNYDADIICEMAGRLGLLGSWLRERKGIYRIKAYDRDRKLHEFKLNPYTCIRIATNTLVSNVLDQLQKDPEHTVLSADARRSKLAAKKSVQLGNPDVPGRL